jgi:hypothetical protein
MSSPVQASEKEASEKDYVSGYIISTRFKDYQYIRKCSAQQLFAIQTYNIFTSFDSSLTA